MIVTIEHQELMVKATAQDGQTWTGYCVDGLSKFLQRFPDCHLEFLPLPVESKETKA